MLHLVKLIYLFLTGLWSPCSNPDWMRERHKWLCKCFLIHLFHLLICHHANYLQNNVCQMPLVQCINHDKMQDKICFRMLTAAFCCFVPALFGWLVNECWLQGHFFFYSECGCSLVLCWNSWKSLWAFCTSKISGKKNHTHTKMVTWIFTQNSDNNNLIVCLHFSATPKLKLVRKVHFLKSPCY